MKKRKPRMKLTDYRDGLIASMRNEAITRGRVDALENTLRQLMLRNGWNFCPKCLDPVSNVLVEGKTEFGTCLKPECEDNPMVDAGSEPQ